MLLLKVYFVGLLSFCVGQGDPPEEQKVIFNFDSDVYVCQDEESKSFIDTSELEAVRHNETTALLTGTFKILQDIVDQFVIELIIMKESNGRYSVVATELICDLCPEMKVKDEDNLYSPFLKFIKLPEECPIAKGEYRVDDMIVDTSDFPINTSNMGRYECIIKFFSSTDDTCKLREYLGCVKLDLLIELLED